MKKIIKEFLIYFFISLSLDCNFIEAQSTTPFSMNGWQFHEYNIPKLEEAILKAPSYGVNFLIFSHRLFRSVEGFLVSDENFDPKKKYPHLSKLYSASEDHTKPHAGWQSDLKYVASLAKKQNIPYYLWIHEFDDIPEKFLTGGDVNFDDPGLFPYIKDRYERLLKVMPNTAGFVLTFHESNYKLFRNTEVKSKYDVPERIYRLTKLIYDVLKEYNKKLILRSFFYEPKEMQYFKIALSRLPDDIIVMSKTTFHEFDPFYPPDSMHGEVGNKKHIIEIDLGVEKALSSEGAYAQTEYIQRFARRAADKKMAGMVGRARFLWDKPFENSHEINLYAFSRFMKDPALSENEVAVDWARKRYNEAAAPYIASALIRTQFINHHCRYHLGVWLTKSIGSEWDDYKYYFGHPTERSIYKWTLDPSDKELEDKIYHPDLEFYNKLIEEKEEVIRQINESFSDIAKAELHLKTEQIMPLKKEFEFLIDAARLSAEWTKAYFAQRLFMDNPKSEYRIWVENALNVLDKMNRMPGVIYGMNNETGHRYNINKFILEMKWRIANRSRAINEDKNILSNIKNKLAVDIN
ncbi:MAG: hypothetical protein NTX65_12775 [Ignavibacteriales bacterium]|nr:hypothetical protein [Ignavibacteriales bacterium]